MPKLVKQQSFFKASSRKRVKFKPFRQR